MSMVRWWWKFKHVFDLNDAFHPLHYNRHKTWFFLCTTYFCIKVLSTKYIRNNNVHIPILWVGKVCHTYRHYLVWNMFSNFTTQLTYNLQMKLDVFIYILWTYTQQCNTLSLLTWKAKQKKKLVKNLGKCFMGRCGFGNTFFFPSYIYANKLNQ